MTDQHVPVLMAEMLDFFRDTTLRVFVDGTLGAGGHAYAILSAHPEIELFIGIDEDSVALDIAKERLAPFSEKVSIVQANFCSVASILKSKQIDTVDGIFLDLGVSSMQLDMAERGMSFSKEGPLDMRRDTGATLTAATIINTWSRKQLGEIFRYYGELPAWRKAADIIVENRARKKITTTTELVSLLSPVLTKRRNKKIHPMTLLFQALRIAVNDELWAIKEVLPAAISVLSTGGLLGVISFHSLEDRIVKQTFKLAASNEATSSDLPGIILPPYRIGAIVTKKPISPGYEEIASNPRSRSAKMRFLKKLLPASPPVKNHYTLPPLP